MSTEHNTKTIVLFTPGPVGGAEKVIVNGQKALKSQCSDIELWVIKEERVPKVIKRFEALVNDSGIKPVYLSCYRIFDLELLVVLKKKLIEAAPGILHAHGFKAALYAWLAKPKNCKLIITHHGRTGHTLKVRLYEWLESKILSRACGVIAVSGPMRAELSRGGIHPKKVFLVENFLTLNLSNKIKNQTSLVKLLFIGRLSPEKGCHILLEAMRDLSMDIELTIVGDGIERDRLPELASNYKLDNRIIFAGFQKDVASYLQKTNALVIPSFREGQPLALIEACCMGVPVIASKVGGIPELIQDGKNGLLFEAGNSSDLKRKIRMFIEYKIVMTTATEAMQQSMQERFAPETWAINILSTYDQVLIQS